MKLITIKLKEYGADVEGAMERFVDDEELYIMCISSYLKDAGFTKVELAIQKKEYDQAFDYAHALKGVAGNLGLLPLYDTLSNLVEKLRNNEYNNIEAICENVIQSYKKIKLLEKYILDDNSK